MAANGLDAPAQHLDDNAGRAPPFAQVANVLLIAKPVQDTLAWDIAFTAADWLTVNGQKYRIDPLVADLRHHVSY